MTDTSPEELQRAFLRYNAALLTLSADLAAEMDLTPSEMAACDHLHMDGPLTPRELGERIRLTSGSVTALVDRLAARGFVERKPNPRDRRSVLVHYRPQERQVVRRQQAVMARMGAVMQAMDGPARRAVREFLDGISSAVLDAAPDPAEHAGGGEDRVGTA